MGREFPWRKLERNRKRGSIQNKVRLCLGGKKILTCGNNGAGEGQPRAEEKRQHGLCTVLRGKTHRPPVP